MLTFSPPVSVLASLRSMSGPLSLNMAGNISPVLRLSPTPVTRGKARPVSLLRLVQASPTQNMDNSKK